MYQGNLNYITNCIIIWWKVVSLTRLWVWRGQIWTWCLPSRRSVCWGKCSHNSADIQGQTSDRCIIGNWKDLLKGSMDCALKSKQESAQGAWAWWSMGFTEAYKHFSSSEHKSLKQKLWGIKLERLPRETVEYLVSPVGDGELLKIWKRWDMMRFAFLIGHSSDWYGG